MDNSIKLKKISELLGMKFFIPSYQRGYRWTEQQVKDLLNDINEFSQKQKQGMQIGFYCLQPLVVKKREMEILDKIKAANTIKEVENLLKGEWEVIDGQQRLTTIFILLYYLNFGNDSLYTIFYETRSGFSDFLLRVNVLIEEKSYSDEQIKQTFQSIVEEDNKYDNIDFYYIFTTYCTINNWFYANKEGVEKEEYKNLLLDNVQFIWYESVEEDPIKVFSRLNVGKISLTNAELIKALFLNRSNFKTSDNNHLKLRQQEIASEWDNIEYTLQNDEFWLFLHEKDYARPTRIDIIFDMICKQNALGFLGNIGTDDYKTFRYFYEYFNSEQSDIEKCWKSVKTYFQIFREWFDDLELYHYIGYLIYQKENLDTLCTLWCDKKTKTEFVVEIKEKIKDKIKKCNDLAKQYEIDGSAKTICKPLLLLHNIQTVVHQNARLKSKKEYKLPVFYKFPFHLFKKENWDVEHIDSNTSNGLEKEKDQKEWLKYSVLGAKLSEELKEKIKAFIRNDSDRESFDHLSQEIEKENLSKSWNNSELDKNKVWNFVLLDASTNRGYGNSIFPAKRRCIIGKDQGKKFLIDDNLNVSPVDNAISFVPPVTKNVFMKYYNTSVEDLRVWDVNDAIAYKRNILEILKDFGVFDSSNS